MRFKIIPLEEIHKNKIRLKRIIDLTNQKFGRLTVLKLDIKTGQNGRAYWLCQCECGIIKSITSYSLKNKTTRSCGCLQRDIVYDHYKLPKGIAAAKRVFRNYCNNAKNNSKDFELTFEEALNFFQLPCHYCGSLPRSISSYYPQTGNFTYNGIDRINNKIGYSKANLVSCCKICNYAKHTMSVSEFKSWITRAYKHLFLSRYEQIA